MTQPSRLAEPVTDPASRAWIARLWAAGYDTLEISKRPGVSEASVYNTLAQMARPVAP